MLNKSWVLPPKVGTQYVSLSFIPREALISRCPGRGTVHFSYTTSLLPWATSGGGILLPVFGKPRFASSSSLHSSSSVFSLSSFSFSYSSSSSSSSHPLPTQPQKDEKVIFKSPMKHTLEVPPWLREMGKKDVIEMSFIKVLLYPEHLIWTVGISLKEKKREGE